MHKGIRGKLNGVRRSTGVIAVTLALAACATPAPPPPPPLPVAIAVAQPAPPLPPAGAIAGMTIPRANAFGTRQTINANLSDRQRLWNLRSAFNVAALNCQRQQHMPITSNYEQFLERYEKQLAITNREVAKEFTARHGSDGRAVQDSYMTSVYNYFALPPTQARFCDVALALSSDALISPEEEIDAFTFRAIGAIEQVYEEFFRSYEAYENDLIAWERLYGPTRDIDSNALANAILAAAQSNTIVSPLPTEGPILREGVTVGDGSGSS